MNNHKRVLSIGQCQIDGPRLRRFLNSTFQVSVDDADTLDEALALAQSQPYDLVLVNRLLNVDRSPGVNVITALLAAQPDLSCMLVSDKSDAQEQAVTEGALPGFGKAALTDPATHSLLRDALKL